MAMIVARPRTFVLPNHCDGDSVLVVIRGKSFNRSVVVSLLFYATK